MRVVGGESKENCVRGRKGTGKPHSFIAERLSREDRRWKRERKCSAVAARLSPVMGTPGAQIFSVLLLNQVQEKTKND